MSNTEASDTDITLTIKGPNALKLTVHVPLENTVQQLKEKIEQEDKNFPVTSQRLIYSGKVLKDAETLESYKMQNGHTVHMVRSAARPTDSGSASNSSTSTTNTSNAPASQGIPTNLSAGQQFTNNPLSALNRADYAGPQMASLMNDAGGMFGNFGGMNPRDPNVMLGMMQNPEFLRHMRDMLAQPEVVDQIIASNPQMQAMAPQMREMLRSEHFREMLTNPESIQRMTQLSQSLGGLGAPGAAWPPPGAFGSTPSNQTNPQTEQNTEQTNAANGANAANPFAALGGLGGLAGLGGAGGFAGLGGQGAAEGQGNNPLAGLAQYVDKTHTRLQQLLGQTGAGGNGNLFPGLGSGNPGAPSDSRPPEERFASQLEQLQNMGFIDASANIRALLMSGGSVEGAVGVLLGN